MPARRRTGRDRRRRRHGQRGAGPGSADTWSAAAAGQVFLADPLAISRLLRVVDVRPDELVVDVGAGGGALTLPLADTGARVVAVEIDARWVARLRDRVAGAGIADRVRVVHGDLRSFAVPAERWRVVANPPFGLTTALLRRLLDDPTRGPYRADLVVQLEVARKRTRQPPGTLRSAAWAPWWTFELGGRIDRRAFRPVPRVDAALLTIRRRDPPVLPTWLAPGFADALRAVWTPPQPGPRRRS